MPGALTAARAVTMGPRTGLASPTPRIQRKQYHIMANPKMISPMPAILPMTGSLSTVSTEPHMLVRAQASAVTGQQKALRST